MAKSRQQIRQEMRKGKPVKNNKNTVWIAVITVVLVAAIIALAYFAVSGGKETANEGQNTTTTDNQTPETENIAFDMEPNVTGDHKKVQVEMENGGKFVIELYPEYAPETVQNFLDLVNDGFYDGLTFHRVVDDFMAQGGEGEVGNIRTVKGEFVSNGFSQNTLSHQRGVVSMARSDDPNSASSQFFICYGDESMLDGNYAAFGKVIEGMEVVDSFCRVERAMNSMGEMATPVTPIVMKKVSVID